MSSGLWDFFVVLPDPRVERTRKHKLEDILTITICGVICGAETWDEIESFGEAKEADIRGKRLKAGWDAAYLLRVLGI